MKVFIAPLQYRSKSGYDASAYWKDRFHKYGTSIQGPGDEGLSEAENEKMYQEAADVFRSICQKERIDFCRAQVLEIGVGTGFYTQILREMGVASYSGIDITDVLFPQHKQDFPCYTFLQADITKEAICGSFSLIVMIDVIQHIVEKEKLAFAMENIKKALAPNGIFIVAPIMHATKKQLFYVHFWSEKLFEELFLGFTISEPIPFRTGSIIVIKNRQLERF
ncbi:MAG: class I SAM-dependent methyltransferase [Limisphaerales bacterium]